MVCGGARGSTRHSCIAFDWLAISSTTHVHWAMQDHASCSAGKAAAELARSLQVLLSSLSLPLHVGGQDTLSRTYSGASVRSVGGRERSVSTYSSFAKSIWGVGV